MAGEQGERALAVRAIEIRVDSASRDLWLRQVGGISLLGRAIIVLCEIAPVRLLGADADLVGCALGARRKPLNLICDTDDGEARATDIVIREPVLCCSDFVHRLKTEGVVSRDRLVGPEGDHDGAEDALLLGARKSIRSDGVVAVFVMRPISRLITRRLLRTRITPNQVTAAAIALGVLAGCLACRPGFITQSGAVAALFAGAVLDCVDGELARVRLQKSRLGEWLDSIADDLSTGAYMLGLGFGVRWLPFGLPPLPFALISVGAFILVNLYIYRVLQRDVGVIDTAQFPYVFMPSRRSPAATPGLGPEVADMLGLAFRRDFFIALFALFALLGQSWLSLLALGFGVGCTAIAVLATAVSIEGEARRRVR